MWNYENGDSVRVTCCTNAAQARLLLDGEVVGEAKPYDRQTGVIYWDIPYRPGRLQVEALNSSGNIVATDEIVTSSTPYALRATVIDECDDIRHILVEIVDINGILVTLADNIKCETGENAALLGLENSNNRDMSPAKSSQRRAYHGRLLAYIRGSGPVRFSSPLLSPASL